jgi:S1-C subfamily serine protease
MSSQQDAASGQKVSFGVEGGKPTNRGLIVEKLNPSSSFGKGGVLIQDELLDIDGVKLTDPKIVLQHLNAVGIGNTVKVRLVRNAKEITVEIKLRPKKSFDYELRDVSAAVTKKVTPAA